MDDNSDLTKSNQWAYCPVCGTQVPKSSRKIRFCMGCGLDLEYTKERKELPPNYQPKVRPSYEMYGFYRPKPKREKIDEAEILEKRNTKLWGVGQSFGFTAISYFAMLIAGVIIMLPAVFLYSGDLSFLYRPELLIVTSLAEIALIVVPLIYIGQFLKKPTIKNRLVLLGFSSREYDGKGILKEFIIGISFAFIGIFIVFFTQVGVELFVKYVFGVEIVYSSGDVDMFISSGNALTIILLALTMIFVVGTSEEILFRGFLQKGLMRSSLGAKNGIYINALIFTFIHIYTVFFYLLQGPRVFIAIFLVYFLPYFVISLMLCYLFYWRKENLIAVIIAHGVYDAITVILAYIFMFY